MNFSRGYEGERPETSFGLKPPDNPPPTQQYGTNEDFCALKNDCLAAAVKISDSTTPPPNWGLKGYMPPPSIEEQAKAHAEAVEAYNGVVEQKLNSPTSVRCIICPLSSVGIEKLYE
jgi:hypothetical protein